MEGLEKILEMGFSLISAVVFAIGLALALVFIIHLGILNRTLHQMKETLEDINKNFKSQTSEQKEAHKGKEK